MAKIDIAGITCTFTSIPISTLQAYGPIQRTHLALWRANMPLHGLYLQMHLRMLESIQAIDRLTLFDIEGGTQGALFDYECASTRLMTDFDNYLRILSPVGHLLECPWRVAKHEAYKGEVDRLYQMDAELLNIYRDKAHSKAPLDRKAVELSLMLTPQASRDYDKLLAATAGKHVGDSEAIEGRRTIHKDLLQP